MLVNTRENCHPIKLVTTLDQNFLIGILDKNNVDLSYLLFLINAYVCPVVRQSVISDLFRRLRITREARCGHLDFSLSILIRAKMRKVKILTRQVETITRKGEISTCVIIFNFSTMKFI